MLIPALPFWLVCLCGLGIMPVTAITHAALWSGYEADAPASALSGEAIADGGGFRTVDPLLVLCAELAKQLVCNLCGIFSAHEQLIEMRFNYWTAKLLQEALQLQQLVRARTHRLVSNTLPAPIVKAIGSGDLSSARVFECCTVLQASSALSAPSVFSASLLHLFCIVSASSLHRLCMSRAPSRQTPHSSFARTCPF